MVSYYRTPVELPPLATDPAPSLIRSRYYNCQRLILAFAIGLKRVGHENGQAQKDEGGFHKLQHCSAPQPRASQGVLEELPINTVEDGLQHGRPLYWLGGILKPLCFRTASRVVDNGFVMLQYQAPSYDRRWLACARINLVPCASAPAPSID